MIIEIEDSPKDWIESLQTWYNKNDELCTDCSMMASYLSSDESKIGLCNVLQNRCNQIKQQPEWIIVFHQKKDDICKRVTEIVNRIQLMDSNRSILFQDRTKPMDLSWNEKDLIIWDMIDEVMQQFDLVDQSFPCDIVSFDKQIEQITSIEAVLKLFQEFVDIVGSYSLFRKEYETVALRVTQTIKKSKHLQKQLQNVSSYLQKQVLDLSDMPRIYEKCVSGIEVSKVEITDLKRIVDSLQHGVHLFQDEWRRDEIRTTLEEFNKNVRKMIKEGNANLKNKDQMCSVVNSNNEVNKLSLGYLETKRTMIMKGKQQVIERIIYLQHRKHCLEEEMNLLEKRKLWDFYDSLTSRQSISLIPCQVWSEVSITQDTKDWKLSHKDYREEYYTNPEEVKVKFRYNSDKGCFEEAP